MTESEKYKHIYTSVIDSLNSAFSALYDKPEDSSVIANELKTMLNAAMDDERNFHRIRCRNIFVSKGNDSRHPYGTAIIPVMPFDIFDTLHITEYDIDIDLGSFINNHNENGFTIDEAVAWFLHELYENMLTDRTLTRFRSLIVKFYDQNNTSFKDILKHLGLLAWVGVFCRTKKEFLLDNKTNIYVSPMIIFGEYQEYWNSALSKYIDIYGGSYDILTDEYIDRMDRTQLYEFNKLARKYSSYTMKYNNTDYSTFARYFYASTGSEMIKHYFETEPQRIIAFKEKDVYNIFDDRKLILESVDGNESSVSKILDFGDSINNSFIVGTTQKVADLALDVDNITTQNEKAYTLTKLYMLESEIAEYRKNMEHVPMRIQELDDQVYCLINKLKNTSVEKLGEVEFD